MALNPLAALVAQDAELAGNCHFAIPSTAYPHACYFELNCRPGDEQTLLEPLRKKCRGGHFGLANWGSFSEPGLSFGPLNLWAFYFVYYWQPVPPH
jgi:hypothetical protein